MGTSEMSVPGSVGSGQAEAFLGAEERRLAGKAARTSTPRGHARSGDRIALAGYLGAGDTVDRAVATFVVAYAEQNGRDHHRLVDAVAAGHISAEPGS